MQIDNIGGGKILSSLNEDLCGCGDLIDSARHVLGSQRQPVLAFIRPKAVIKTYELSGEAFVDFPVNRIELYPDYRQNPAELLAIIDDTTLDPDARDHKMRDTYPDEYRFMLQTWYPALRRSDYLSSTIPGCGSYSNGYNEWFLVHRGCWQASHRALHRPDVRRHELQPPESRRLPAQLGRRRQYHRAERRADARQLRHDVELRV